MADEPEDVPDLTRGGKALGALVITVGIVVILGIVGVGAIYLLISTMGVPQ